MMRQRPHGVLIANLTGRSADDSFMKLGTQRQNRGYGRGPASVVRWER
jgi:hypothetical protein